MLGTIGTIGHVNAFMKLIRHTLPELIKSLDSIRQALLTTAEPKGMGGPPDPREMAGTR
jgi:hypothetical protein